MYPYIEIFGRVIGLYAILAVAGGLIAGVYCCRAATKKGLDDNNIIAALLWSALFSFLGAHLLYLITNLKYFINFLKHLDDFGSLPNILKSFVDMFGGMVFYGGLIGGVIAGCIYLKRKKLDFGRHLDVFAPAIPLFHAFGRVGCFMGGCCYGMEINHGITFHNSPIVEANEVSRLPVQLIEAGFNIILFMVLAYFLSKSMFKGKLILIYLGAYALERFIIEFFRADELRGNLHGISTSQIISIFIIIVVIIAVVYSNYMDRKKTILKDKM